MKKPIVIIGRFFEREKLFGSEKFVKRLFEFLYPSEQQIQFIDFFFGYNFSVLRNKVFGNHDLAISDGKSFQRMGLVPIFQYLSRERPAALLITNLEGYGLYAAIIARVFGTKIFYFINGIYHFELISDKLGAEPLFFKIKNRLLERLLIRTADILIVPSTKAKKQLLTFYGPIDKEVRIIPHGADQKFFISKENIDLNRPIKMVYAGGFGRGLKGFEFLISALKNIEIDLELNIVGEISDKTKCERQLGSLPAAISTRIHGFSDSTKMSEIFRTCDIGIIPSKFETFSITALEMAASSLAIVMTAETGASELFEHNKSAIILKFGDTAALNRVIQELDQNREQISQLGSTARSVAENHTWNKVTDILLRLLNSDEKN